MFTACDALDPGEPTVLYLSADDSNSMASPVIFRRLIETGASWWRWSEALRPFEFLNYYALGYAPAAAGTLAVSAEATRASSGQLALTVGVASEAAAPSRRPMNLTFVLDTSGSMAGAPLELLRGTVQRMAAQLRAGDRVSLVTWSTEQRVLLDRHTAVGPSDPAVLGALVALTAGGGTDLAGGLRRGYELATAVFEPTRLNRVVLISDGVANVGITDENVIGQGAALHDGDGIYLVGVGVGAGVNDTLMNVVTDRGRGAYVYLDGAAEIERLFGARFDEVMDVAARALQVRLTLPWYMRMARFYGEEYSTNPRVVEAQHLAPSDAMVFHQIIAACAPDRLGESDPVEVLVRWSTPTTHELRSVGSTTTLGALLAATPRFQPKAVAILAWADALRGTDGAAFDRALRLIAAADPARDDPELGELRALATRARARLP